MADVQQAINITPPIKQTANTSTPTNISREARHIFSCPFNSFKLGLNCAATAYSCHLKRLAKFHREKLIEHKDSVFVCHDKDCKRMGHLRILQKYIDAA